MTNCSCHSGKPYQECCKPFHQGALPPTALQLMRSRYAAYARSLPSYIIETTHPANPSYKENRIAWVKEILQFCKGTQFVGLDIHENIEDEKEAFVTFTAHLIQEGRKFSFQERSRFEKVEGKWLYSSS